MSEQQELVLPGVDDACQELRSGSPVIVPNPSPMTYGVVYLEPSKINKVKGRPLRQNVAISMHDPLEWKRLAPELDVPAELLPRIETILRTRITMMVPVRPGGGYSAWIAPAVKDGQLLMFNGWWGPTGPLWDQFPRLYGSSANVTGSPAADTAPKAREYFPDLLVMDGDELRDQSVEHSPSTIVRIDRAGALSMYRHGGHDRATGLPSAEYLRSLTDLHLS